MVSWATAVAHTVGDGSNILTLNPNFWAACADMRPNCPPPKIPIVSPGETGLPILFFLLFGGSGIF